MVSEDEDGKLMFKVNYHYMSQVKNASDTNSAARSRRLAQEAVTLSTSLPLSSSSSVFVRCDEERLDIMKVKFHFSCFSTILGLTPVQTFEMVWNYHVIVLFGFSGDVIKRNTSLITENTEWTLVSSIRLLCTALLLLVFLLYDLSWTAPTHSPSDI